MPRIDRTLALYGLVFAIAGALFVALFWATGAINLQTDAGLISQLELSGLWLTGYYLYPFVTFFAVVAGLVAFLANRNEAALALAGLPVAGVILYYLALTV